MDASLTERILDETLRTLQDRGYAALRIERVAAVIGCSKTTIYRRWPTRAELTVDALQHHVELGADPDTGNVVDDLIEHAWQNALNQEPPEGTTNYRRTLWAAVVEPEVSRLFWERFLSLRRARGRAIVDRGISRGELPADTDADTLLDLLAGLTFYRGTFRDVPLSRSDYRRVVLALTASPPLIVSPRD